MARPIPFVVALTCLLLASPAQVRRGEARRLGPALELARSWQDLDQDERQRALRNFERYRSLPESGRQRMDRSYESWQRMNPSERERVQKNYERYRQMTPDQRRDFQERYQRWKKEGGR